VSAAPFSLLKLKTGTREVGGHLKEGGWFSGMVFLEMGDGVILRRWKGKKKKKKSLPIRIQGGGR